MKLGMCADFLCPFIWSRVSDLMRFCDGSIKGTVSVHTILCDDVTFLSRAITGVESWIYDYSPDTKQQSSQWKSPKSLRPKKVRQVKSEVKSMLIIFFDIKGIVRKEFVRAGQTVSYAHYCDCENV
jgi:hypothetical protein